MMCRCDSCHATFSEPAERIERENLDGENGIFYAQYAVCPYCGESWFSEIPEEEESE